MIGAHHMARKDKDDVELDPAVSRPSEDAAVPDETLRASARQDDEHNTTAAREEHATVNKDTGLQYNETMTAAVRQNDSVVGSVHVMLVTLAQEIRDALKREAYSDIERIVDDISHNVHFMASSVLDNTPQGQPKIDEAPTTNDPGTQPNRKP